jgi:YD repeat-containing protein
VPHAHQLSLESGSGDASQRGTTIRDAVVKQITYGNSNYWYYLGSYHDHSSGNRTSQVKAPGETGSYTNQSQLISTCTDSSILPCLHEDSSSVQYSSAISRTFYDQLGRAVETQDPSADGSHTIVSFTLYNDAAHTVFSSQPFTLAGQSNWVDPNSYTSTPGTLSTLDALGRTVSVLDAVGKTTSRAYGLGSVSGDSNTYATSTGTDANGHVAESFTDALGRTLYSQTDSGKAGGTLTPNKQTTTQYNVLGLPTSITVKDLAPQSGQTITSVTTTAQYDDLGRETSIVDPDRGTHTYSYDADGNLISDVSGTRTLGYSYDLLGRVGCVQDSTPTPDVHGACSSGANPFVKNTYDADPGGVTWSGSNYPVGELTQSVAITYLPNPDNAQGTDHLTAEYGGHGRLAGLPHVPTVSRDADLQRCRPTDDDADRRGRQCRLHDQPGI